MADERKGAYAEVEGLKKGKFKIARDYRRLELILSIFISVIFLFLFSGDIFSTEMMYISVFSGLSDSYKGKFNYPLFAAIYIPFLFGAYLFFNGKLFTDEKGFIGKISTKQRKLGSFVIHTIFRYDKKKDTMSYLDILNTPFRILNNTLFFVPKDLRPKIGLRIGYIDHLNKNFFNQVVEKEDGYSRVKELKFFQNPEYIFKGYYDSVRSLFKDEKSFKDLLMIIEGYLVEGKLYDTRIEDPLKDDLFRDDFYKNHRWFIIMNKMLELEQNKNSAKHKQRSQELETEFKKKHGENWQAELVKIEQELKKRNYKYFVSYMLRPNAKGELVDNVTLSRASIRYYIEENCKRFKEFIENALFNNGQHGSEFYQGLLQLVDDIHFRDKLINRKKPLKEYTADEKEELLSELDKVKKLSRLVFEISRFEAMIEDYKLSQNKNIKDLYDKKAKSEKETTGIREEGFSELFKKRIVEMLMADFCLVMFRMVIGQYMNLPAGTMVVKIDSYDTRVIIEYYKQQSTINIEEKKNDGTSKLFNSDRYANLFFICFWYFCNVNDKETFGQLNFRFNTSETAKPHTFEQIAKSIDEKGIYVTAEEQAEEEVENRKTKEIKEAFGSDDIKKDDASKAWDGARND